MHKITKTEIPDSPIVVVEIRSNVRGGYHFDKKADMLLAGSFEDAGYSYKKVSRYHLGFSNHVVADGVKELLKELNRSSAKLILAVGAEAQKHLCMTKKTLDVYAGSLTWNRLLNKWVLPSQHPSVVYVGPKKTLNSRYDKFDVLFDHIHRAVDLITGEVPFPPVEGVQVPWELIGHNGIAPTDNSQIWSGYYEARESEVDRAEEIFSDWLRLLDSAHTQEATLKFAIDSESRNLNIFKPQGFLMVQIYDGEKAYAFNAGVLHHPQVQPLVKLFLGHAAGRFYLWNTKYDRQVLWHEFNRDLEDRDLDGMVLAMGITEKGKQCGLKYRSRQDLNAPFYEEALDEFIDWNDVNFGQVPPVKLAEYGCKDVYYTFHEIPILLKKVKKEGTLDLIKNILMPAQRTLADIEYQGMYVDLDFARETSAKWEPLIEDAIRKVQDYARDVGFPLANSGIGRSYKSVCECVPVRARYHLEGLRVLSYAKRIRESKIEVPDCRICSNKRYVSRLDVTLNVNSSTQMQHLCFDVLGMKELPSEPRSTNKAFWKFNGNHELSKLVAAYKELQYLRRNFLEGVQQFVAEDGKVHPDFLLFGTKTGRLAIHKPAMQTIPQHGENAKIAKKLFIADPDCLVVNVDYKSLEMFMAHHLTGDPKLLENLLGEWDVHTALAAVAYIKDSADVTPKERQSVKSVNFGAGYGISGFKLALDPAMEEATGGDPDKAQEFIDSFWGMYSVWAAKCDEWRELAHTQQYITTELGRKRRWNLITADNKNKVNNQAINFPGQSMASDLCLSSLVRLHKLLQDKGWGRVLLSVHDALVFNIKKEFIHEAVELIVKEMTTPPFETDTPFAVDVELGYSYGEKEPYDTEKVWV